MGMLMVVGIESFGGMIILNWLGGIFQEKQQLSGTFFVKEFVPLRYQSKLISVINVW